MKVWLAMWPGPKFDRLAYCTFFWPACILYNLHTVHFDIRVSRFARTALGSGLMGRSGQKVGAALGVAQVDWRYNCHCNAMHYFKSLKKADSNFKKSEWWWEKWRPPWKRSSKRADGTKGELHNILILKILKISYMRRKVSSTFYW